MKHQPMPVIDIPLLKESFTYKARLSDAVLGFNETRYASLKRLNWSHRYSEDFYKKESELFLKFPDGYINNRLQDKPVIENIFARRLQFADLLSIVIKFAAHRLFSVAGSMSRNREFRKGWPVYRRCYVDDIELVFDPEARDSLRVVFPFPLSMRRQIAYLQRIRREKRRFVFDGHPYLFGDLLRLLRRRDVHSLMRMESRAQVLLARRIARNGFTKVEMSDEFNLGSLDFSLSLARWRVETINSAHGVGKYLPAHAYRRFDILTRKQRDFYVPLLPCEYRLRSLNVLHRAGNDRSLPATVGLIDLVFLSQTFPGLEGVVRETEEHIIARLAEAWAGDPGVKLWFKPHPTQGERPPPQGFANLSDLSDVNGREGTIFLSQFSTCQIDPAFKGLKVLIRSKYVHPEIVFDDDEPIMTIDDVIQFVNDRRPPS